MISETSPRTFLSDRDGAVYTVNTVHFCVGRVADSPVKIFKIFRELRPVKVVSDGGIYYAEAKGTLA